MIPIQFPSQGTASMRGIVLETVLLIAAGDLLWLGNNSALHCFQDKVLLTWYMFRFHRELPAGCYSRQKTFADLSTTRKLFKFGRSNKHQRREVVTYFEDCRFLEESVGFYSCIRRALADLSGLQKSRVANTRFYCCQDEGAQCSHIESNSTEEFEFGC